MGVFRLFANKKNNYQDYDEYEENFDNLLNESNNQSKWDTDLKEQIDFKIDSHQSEKLEHINLSKYSKNDIQKYIISQCDLLNETSKYIENAKREYSVVTSYFSDIQLIETAPEALKNNLQILAKKISELTVDRKIFRSTDRKISNGSYSIMERIEPEMPGILVDMQNHEAYFQTVKKDVKVLEGARAALRYDARDLVKKQHKIRMISVMSMISLVMIFTIFIALLMVSTDQNNFLFLIVIGLAAVFTGGLFSILKRTEQEVILTEKKLNKATNLLNKTKIKYVNSANTLDYEYAKYGVKNSYELSRQFEAYLEEKNQKEKLKKVTDDLNQAEEKLELILKSLKLYDYHIWLSQIKALINPNEMVEVRHELSIRRQKLRTQIEYNLNRMEDIKQEIKRITISNPEYTNEVLSIIENYESESI